MKVNTLLIACLLFLSTAHASSTPKTNNDPILNAVMIPIQGTDFKIGVGDYLKLTPKTYKLITGKKMSFSERVELNVRQKMIRKMLRKENTLSKEKMQNGFFGQWEWHWGGFALGFTLSFLGVIICLFFNDDYKWDRFWTALKTATVVLLILAAIIAAGSGA